jgi:hypothetical protein
MGTERRIIFVWVEGLLLNGGWDTDAMESRTDSGLGTRDPYHVIAKFEQWCVKVLEEVHN